MGEVEVVCGSSALISEDGEAVAVVDEEDVFTNVFEEFLEGCEVAVGGEDRVGEDDGGGVEGIEDLVGVGGVEMVVGVDGHLREVGGVLEGRVGAGVDDGVVDSQRREALEGGEVGGVSVGDEEGVVESGEVCECGFEVRVGLGVACGLARGGGGESEGGQSGLGGGDDLGVVGESEVVASSAGKEWKTISGDMGGAG